MLFPPLHTVLSCLQVQIFNIPSTLSIFLGCSLFNYSCHWYQLNSSSYVTQNIIIKSRLSWRKVVTQVFLVTHLFISAARTRSDQQGYCELCCIFLVFCPSGVQLPGWRNRFVMLWGGCECEYEWGQGVRRDTLQVRFLGFVVVRAVPHSLCNITRPKRSYSRGSDMAIH